jgi:hypothetical protein
VIGRVATAAAVCAAAACAPASNAQAVIIVKPMQFASNGRLLTSAPVPVTLYGELKLTNAALGEIACNVVLSGSVWNQARRGAGTLEGLTAPRCNAPTLENVYEDPLCTPAKGCEKVRPLTVFVTAELPLEAEEREAEVCAEEAKTEVSQCPNSSERTVQALSLRLRRRTPSFAWKLEPAEEESVELEGAPYLVLGIPPEGQSCYPTELVEGKQVAARWQSVPAGCIRLDIVVPQVGFEGVVYGTLEPGFTSGAGNGLDASRLELEYGFGKLVSGAPEGREFTAKGIIRLGGSEARELITPR